jgi:putative DNA methylase
LPLEAQRLGLESYASDLNPVAVLINKAMIEIPPKFAGRPPVNPKVRGENTLIAKSWTGAQGLAEDVRYYGKWMRDEAEKRIGHLYPKVEVTAAMAKARPDLKPYVGRTLTVVAWLWARTVKSPNPAFAKVEVPLASTFMLSTKPGKEAYVEPVIENGGYHFTVKVGKPNDAEGAKNGTAAGKRAAFKCVMSGTPLPYDYIRTQGQAGRMGARLMAIVAEGERERVYLAPMPEHEKAALNAKPGWKPEVELPVNPRDFKTPNYGLMTFADLFTPRQLVALTALSDLVQDVRERIRRDSLEVGVSTDSMPLRDGGAGATAYAEAVGVYLAFALSKLLDRSCALVTWFPERDSTYHVFGRQALPMTWDFAETNVLHDGSGSYINAVVWEAEVVEVFNAGIPALASQVGAQNQTISRGKVVSTDPPYYDNIGYADLSDFFYVWLRRALQAVYPDLFATLAVPKSEELVATPYRHGSKEKAETFFLGGMIEAMHRLAEQPHPAFPVTIYYAFKQAENRGDAGTASTGWETFLDAMIHAGFAITGTWPVRTELANRILAKGNSALASSIILVCRPRAVDAPTATRREFTAALTAELPQALAHLQRGNIAPVDLAQAAIGPGMAIYTRYAKILDAQGHPLSVREALALINQTLDEALAEQEGDFDADSRWALAWFEESGFADGEYGVAETLSKAKNTSVQGLVEAGILKSSRGKVRLLRPKELPDDWDPTKDPRLSAWEVVHHLVRALESGGESAAADLVTRLGVRAETARELAYRLYALCERKKRADDALSYNGLVQSWPEITRLAREGGKPQAQQGALFTEEKE